MLGRPAIRKCVGASAALVMFTQAVPACAQAQAFSFDIKSQDLGSALKAFARTSHQQVAFDSAIVRGKVSPPLKGTFGAREALDMLLRGSGLVPEVGKSGLFIIHPGNVGSGGAADAALAVGGGAQTTDSSSGGGDQQAVIVTGTRLRGAVAGPAKVNSYSREQVARTGSDRIEALLNTLPEVSIVSAGNATRGGAQNTVRLRGLPLGTTAVLVDGKRLGLSGNNSVQVFDLNLIPASVIDRIDIVPIGSSAVYGTDAIGGVLNIILRRNLNGGEFRASEGFASDYRERNASIAWGRTWNRASLELIAGYHKNDGIFGPDRGLIGDWRRFGGPDTRSQNCDPGTVTAVTGTLNGVGTARAAIPATGANNASNYVAGAGQQNLCGYYLLEPLVAPSERFAGLARFSLQAADDLTFYVDLFASRTRNETQLPTFSVNNALVPASNAFNPFGQAVLVSTVLPTPKGDVLKSRFFRPLVGLRGGLFDHWDFDASVYDNIIIDRSHDVSLLSPLANLMLASSDPSQALNLFSPKANAADLIQAAVQPDDSYSRTEQQVGMFVARGPLIRLPAGAVQTALGFEVRRESLSTTIFPGVLPLVTGGGRRNAQALFGEIAVPVFGTPKDDIALSLSAAARYDNYSDFGGHVTPQYGFALRLPDGLQVKGDYSEAFKAPGLVALSGSQSAYAGIPGFDPRRNEQITTTVVVGGNPALKPETGRSQSISLSWSPPQWPGLVANIMYWRIQEANRIGAPNYQAVLNAEAMFPGRVIRGPSTGALPGPVQSVNSSFLNFGNLRLSGVDVDISYRLSTSAGDFIPSLRLTDTLGYKTQLLPGLPYNDRLAKAALLDSWAPRIKATAGAEWRRGRWSAGISGRYLSRYVDYQDIPNTNHLGNYWLVDANLEVPLPDFGLLRRQGHNYLLLTAQNLLDRRPQYSAYNGAFYGYDMQQWDIRGRFVSLTLGAQF